MKKIIFLPALLSFFTLFLRFLYLSLAHANWLTIFSFISFCFLFRFKYTGQHPTCFLLLLLLFLKKNSTNSIEQNKKQKKPMAAIISSLLSNNSKKIGPPCLFVCLFVCYTYFFFYTKNIRMRIPSAYSGAMFFLFSFFVFETFVLVFFQFDCHCYWCYTWHDGHFFGCCCWNSTHKTTTTTKKTVIHWQLIDWLIDGRIDQGSKLNWNKKLCFSIIPFYSIHQWTDLDLCKMCKIHSFLFH